MSDNMNPGKPEIKLTVEEGDILLQPVVLVEDLLTPVELKVGSYSVEESELDKNNLTEEEKDQVREFSAQIDLTNTQLVLHYGMSSQKKLADFSESTLKSIRTKDAGEVGKMLVKLTSELKDFTIDPEEDKGFFGFFKKSANWLTTLKTRYATVETNISQITDTLESHRIQMLKDISMLDQMYGVNLVYFKELTMYILAGREKLAEAINVELPEMKKKALESGFPSDAQAVRDFEEMCNRFDTKLYDLDLTRTISLQMAPQIRLVQNNDSLLVEKINTSIINTIPLWKNQMTLALGLANAQQALEAQRAVTNMTNDLLKKNADMLKTSSVETAKEAERGIVDIETIKYTSQQLISTIDEIIQVQETGRQKRRQAEIELVQIESDLKHKLLSATK